MSEKCANIFRPNSSLEDCKKFMKELDALPTKDIKTEFLSLRGAMANAPPVTSKTLHILEPFFKLLANIKIKMVLKSNVLLLTSELWEWGEAYMNALDISKKLSIECLTIDNQEYGGFVLHLIRKGEVISKHICDVGLNFYGFEDSSIDFKVFRKAIGQDSPELETAFAEKNKTQIKSGLSGLLGIDCTITVDDLGELLADQTPKMSNKRCDFYMID